MANLSTESMLKNLTTRDIKKIEVENYLVNKNEKRFTETDLNNHKNVFNPSIFPEFFNFEHLGLDYVNTILMENKDLDAVTQSGFRQKYRKGVNKEYNTIRYSVNDIGVDVRCKMVYLAIRKNGEMIDIFSGNTIHSIMNASTNLENRIVSIFRENDDFTISNMIKVGVRLNTLTRANGEATPTDIKFALQEIVRTGEMGFVSDASTPQEKQQYANELLEAISTMANKSLKDVEKTKKFYGIANEIINDQLLEDQIFIVKNGAGLMKYLHSTTNQFNNSKLVHYASYSSRWSSKVIHYMANDFARFADSEQNNITSKDYFDYKNGTYSIILHNGELTAQDPIGDFFTHTKRFFDEFYGVSDFCRDHYVTGDNKQLNSKISIVGIFQQVKDLDHILPYLSVVSYDTFMDAYDNYYLKNNTLPPGKKLVTIDEDDEDFDTEEDDEIFEGLKAAA